MNDKAPAKPSAPRTEPKQWLEAVAYFGRAIELDVGAEGPLGPVVLLAGLRRGEPQIPLQQCIQAEGGEPQELGADHGVKDPGEGKAEVSLQGGQVVGGPVKDLDPPGIRAEGCQW